MPPQGDQCVFCQLISNPSELKLVGETENFYAWLEYPQPRAKGQTNVVPKDHIESIMDLTPEEYSEAMGLVREVMEKAKEGLDADGITTAIHVDEIGGQMLDHVYIQVLPRYEEDENAGTPVSAIFQHIETDDAEIEDIKDKMASVDVDFGVETVEPHPDSQKFKEESSPESSHEESGDSASSENDKGQDEDIKEDFEGRSYSWE